MILPFYTYEFDDDDTVVVMDCNSLVDIPAHMKPLVTFKNQRATMQKGSSSKQDSVYRIFNEEERLVMGVLISAGTPIYRNDPDVGEYFGVFTKQVITKMKEKFMKQNLIHNMNTMHNGKLLDSSKVFMVEIFQVDSKRGIQVPVPLQNQNLQDGTLIGTYKILDNEVWNAIKEGKFRGFSIEAYLGIKEAKLKVKQNKQSNMKRKNTNKGNSFLAFFGLDSEEETEVFTSATDMDGTVLSWEGDLDEGTAIMVVVNEERTPAPVGEYQLTLEDGTIKMVTIDDSGLVTSVADVEEMTAMEVREEVAEVMKKVLKKQESLFTSMKKEIADLKSEIEFLKDPTKRKQEKHSGKNPLKSGGEGTVSWKELQKK